MRQLSKLVKPIQEAIQNELEMYWTSYRDEFHMDLVAVTWWYENGNYRTKHLWGTYDINLAKWVDRTVRDSGGKIIGSLEKVLAHQAETKEELDRWYARLPKQAVRS